MLEPEESIQPGKPYERICLGVLGKREDIKKDEFFERIMHPIMGTLGRVPDVIYLPSDGASSALIGLWADQCNLKSETIVADWRKLGRKAVALRDSRILKASTHLLLFEQPKSEYLLKLGIRELKKGKQIFSVSAGKEWDLQEWEQESKCAIH